MSKHELKTDAAVFQAVYEGKKTYEIRLNDRGFKEGDRLLLRETQHCGADMYEHGFPLIYTGREIEVKVSHILYGPIYGLAPKWCIMSIALLSSPRTYEQGVEEMRERAATLAESEMCGKHPDACKCASCKEMYILASAIRALPTQPEGEEE